VLLGPGNIVLIERVLRAYVTADVALAEMYARALLHSLRVGERLRMRLIERIRQTVVPVLIKGHSQRKLTEASTGPGLVRGLLDHLHAFGPLIIRDLLHIHEPRDFIEMRLQLLKSN